MSSAEESPAQRAARLRREKREAKIKAGGTARLDRITGLSGRTPSSAREESSPSPQLTPTPEPQAQPQPQRRHVSPLPPSPNVEDQTPENIQAQEEYLRALLRSKQPIAGDENAQQEDATAKLLSSLMGGNMPGMPGEGGGASGTGSPPELSPSDLTSALGIPSYLSNFFLGGQSQPPTPLDKRRDQIWKFVHVFFSLVAGLYLLLIFQASVSTYGTSPPPPATAQNPFTLFITGEVVLTGARMLTKARSGQLNGGMRTAISLLGDFARDGKIAIFVLGMGLWWLRTGDENEVKS